MSYEDLPEDWPERPVTDPELTHNILDLVVRMEDRMRGAVVFLVCDEADRLLQPFCVTDITEGMPPHERAELFGRLAQAIGEGAGGLMVCRARPGPATPTDDDRDWHQHALDALRGSGARLLGFHVATCDEIVELPPPLQASA